MTEEEEIFEETQEAEEAEEAAEAVEEEIEIPAPPPLKRARSKKEPVPEKAPKEDLKQRVECQDCGRQVSLHTLRYGKHRCPGKKEAPAKPALPEKEVIKPLKRKATIQKAARIQEHAEQSSHDEYMQGMLPPIEPVNPFTQLQMQRQAQARLRAEATVSPCAQMFAAQRSRIM